MALKVNSVTFSHSWCLCQSHRGGGGGRGEGGGGLFQSWEDHTEKHPSLNPSCCSRKMAGLACHSWQQRHIWLQPGTCTVFYICYIKRSLKTIGIKARKNTGLLLPACRQARVRFSVLMPAENSPAHSIHWSLSNVNNLTSGPSVIGFLI